VIHSIAVYLTGTTHQLLLLPPHDALHFSVTQPCQERAGFNTCASWLHSPRSRFPWEWV